MEEELASTRRALEDERMAGAVDLKNANQVLNEALAQSSSVSLELEQLRRERDELRIGLEVAELERDAMVQGHDVAIQECDLAVQECDVAIQE